MLKSKRFISNTVCRQIRGPRKPKTVVLLEKGRSYSENTKGIKLYKIQIIKNRPINCSDTTVRPPPPPPPYIRGSKRRSSPFCTLRVYLPLCVRSLMWRLLRKRIPSPRHRSGMIHSLMGLINLTWRHRALLSSFFYRLYTELQTVPHLGPKNTSIEERKIICCDKNCLWSLKIVFKHWASNLLC